ncbi:MAG: hypothetical protein IKF91_02030 [Bacilli bacterium]|nr:hypothetical protein [Bacilli bacterium]
MCYFKNIKIIIRKLQQLYKTVSQILDEKDTDIFMDEMVRMNLEESILTEWEARML